MRNKAALWLCIQSYSTSISTHLEYLLRSNEIQVCFSLFSQRGTGHVKLTTKSSQIISAWRHFYSLPESWATRIEYINSWNRNSKIDRYVTTFNFSWWMTDSPIQITIHEIRHFTLTTELLTFTIYFVFLCKSIWGNVSVSRCYCNLLSFSLSWHLQGNGVQKKYFPRVPFDYTTCDGCYFQIRKLQYICNAHVTFFKIFWTNIWSYISVIKQQI